jgi:hypothetical protein
MSEEAMIDTSTGFVDWRSAGMFLGRHLQLAAATPEVVLIHSRGWSTGPRHDRLYVPAQYHVFRVLSRTTEGIHRLEHLISIKARLDTGGPSNAPAIPWRPFPDPAAAPTNGNKPHNQAQ